MGRLEKILGLTEAQVDHMIAMAATQRLAELGELLKLKVPGLPDGAVASWFQFHRTRTPQALAEAQAVHQASVNNQQKANEREYSEPSAWSSFAPLAIAAAVMATESPSPDCSPSSDAGSAPDCSPPDFSGGGGDFGGGGSNGSW
jgi:hypothetical protein